MACLPQKYFHWFDARLLPNALYILVLPPSTSHSEFQYQIFHAYSTSRTGMLFSYNERGEDGYGYGWNRFVDNSFNRPPVIVSVRIAEVSERDWKEISDTIVLASSVARSQRRSMRQWLEICVDGLMGGRSHLVKGNRTVICDEVDAIARATPPASFGPGYNRFVDAKSCRIEPLGIQLPPLTGI